ncbi:MAG: hypothetical protein KTR15_12835 [Phycisphaeraceae bacterium]|nr:hypothetical protein [Phycisphaeraceae bacterium]
MHSLSSIPEPCNNGPKPEAEDAPQRLPMAAEGEAPLGRPGLSSEQPAKPDADADQQVDNLAILLVLLIAGALLRLVLGLLGPLQGIDPVLVEHAERSGSEVLTGGSTSAYPLVDLMALGIGSVGVPAWLLVAVGSLMTLIAVPAAYIIGCALTGRPTTGIVAAAIIAVHPGVLTAANSYNHSAVALGLVTLGLALLCTMEKRGSLMAWAGGITLGLAGLAAPLCWLAGALAGPVAWKLSRQAGASKAIGAGLLVLILALAPAAAYRTAYLGHDASAILTERSTPSPAANTPGPMDQLLVTMTGTSFLQLGEAMHLPLGDAGRLKINYSPQPSANKDRDIVADTLADGWLLLNAALAGMAAVSTGVMLARRRFAETLLLALPLAAIAFTTLPPTEVLRLPMTALVGVLATGLLATKSVPVTDEAAREAKRVAKRAKREEKERAKQDRELAKHKESLYAFDKPEKPKPTNKPAADTDPPEGILTQRNEPAPELGARPI